MKTHLNHHGREMPASMVVGDSREKMTEETLRILQSVLYRITPERPGGLMQQVKYLNKNTENRLQGAIELILDQTVSEPTLATLLVVSFSCTFKYVRCLEGVAGRGASAPAEGGGGQEIQGSPPVTGPYNSLW